MRNAFLYKTLKEYCKAAVSYLEVKAAKPDGLPFTVKEKFEFTEDGGYSYSYAPEILWHMLVSKAEGDFGRLEVYQKAIQALEGDAQIAKHLNTLVGTKEFRSRVDASTCLRSLLIHLLQEQQNLGFHNVMFDKVYQDFEDYFYRDVVEYRFLSPLNNFQIENERIELSPGFFIIKIPKDEREKMLSQSRQFGLFSQYQMMPFDEYAFELYLKVPKVFGEGSPVPEQEYIPSQVARKQFDEACSALRLFKNGAVSYDYIRVGTTSWELHGGTSTVGLVGRRPSIGPRYLLSNEEAPEFLKFWHLFQKARRKKQKRIDVALRRFNFAYERVRPEDRLIDYLIGFEALLLKGEERQELEYRLALRGSVLLGRTSEERKKVFDELKTAYHERSNIVHGGTIREAVKIGTDKLQFNEFVVKLEQHLRSAIKEFLRSSETQSESKVIKDLDDKIVGES